MGTPDNDRSLTLAARISFDPQWLFRLAGMPLMNYPEIFVCLAMVIGLYGLIYFQVALEPERGW